ncbi:hypothetical protein [Flexithrix dorotheae]|uniref:hypothetical protein n=1 Tax=Flexithrix dorotheae TaxID=70993 RepID=UPI00037DCA0B|nr:hypothetical protein [Flexithrix dorotheae]
MRISLIEAQQLENLLLEEGDPADRLVMEARLQINKELKEKAYWQALTYRILKHYGREKLKREINMVEKKLFTSPKYKSFQDRIFSIL